MFYCHSCAARYEWPESATRSFGRCEMCERNAQDCYNVPSIALPLPGPDTPLPWVFDDGGREAAGYRGMAGDCVVRAYAIVTRTHYADAYRLFANAQGGVQRSRGAKPEPRSARNGVLPSVYKPIFAERGLIWTPLVTPGVKAPVVHFRRGEVPRTGRHILRLSKHLCALVEGTVRDNHIDDRGGSRMVYGYWTCKDA